jgi:hypothetical protein
MREKCFYLDNPVYVWTILNGAGQFVIFFVFFDAPHSTHVGYHAPFTVGKKLDKDKKGSSQERN